MIKNVIFSVLLFSGVSTAVSSTVTDQFKINSFSKDSMCIDVPGNTIIKPIINTTLQQITTAPDTLKSGQVLLRRRFSAKEYGLYLGLMNPKAYSKLSAFKTEDNLTVTDFINRKIFSSHSDNPDQDIENVYFDGDLIYVENIASIFFFDSTWKEMKKLYELPCRINITSEPSGALVYINNVYQGVTPLYLGAIYELSVVVRLDMKGYFITDKFIDLQSGVLIEKNFELQKKPTFDDSTEIDPGVWSTDSSSESVIEITQRIEAINMSALKVQVDSVNTVDAFVKKYPIISPQDQFETTDEFLKRQMEFNTKFKNERDELSRQFHETRKRLLDLIPQMEIYLNSIKEREYTKYFDGNLLKLSKYNADSGFFPVSMQVDEDGFAFSFEGKLVIPREQAKEFYAKGTGSGKILLIYKNWQISLSRDTAKANYYVYFTGFKLKFKDVNYDLKGNCFYPAFIENSPEYIKFTNELDEKREKERIAREARGTVYIEVQPKSAKPEVFVGSTQYGTAPCSLVIQPGEYLLTLKADRYSLITDSIFVIKDSLVKKIYQMNYTKEYMDSLSIKKKKIKKKIQIIRRIAFSSLAVAFGGIGYYFERDAKKDYKYYQNLPPNAGTEYDNAWHHYTEDLKLRNIGYTLSGISLGLFAISIPF